MIKAAVELDSAIGDCFLQDVAMTDLFAKTQSRNNLKDFMMRHMADYFFK